MADFGIVIANLDAVRAKFASAPQAIERELRIGMTQALALLHDDIATYPPETEANRPPGALNPATGKPYGHWYERGRGTVYLSGRIDPTSQQLGRSWTETLDVTSTTWQGILGNKASYAPNVQDQDHQASFHKARGWKTIQSVMAENRTRIIEVLQSAVDRALNFGGNP